MVFMKFFLQLEIFRDIFEKTSRKFTVGVELPRSGINFIPWNSADNNQHPHYHSMRFILSFCNIAICPHFLVRRKDSIIGLRGGGLAWFLSTHMRIKWNSDDKVLYVNSIILVGVGKGKARTGLLWGSPISSDMFLFAPFFFHPKIFSRIHFC